MLGVVEFVDTAQFVKEDIIILEIQNGYRVFRLAPSSEPALRASSLRCSRSVKLVHESPGESLKHQLAGLFQKRHQLKFFGHKQSHSEIPAQSFEVESVLVPWLLENRGGRLTAYDLEIY